MIALMTTNDKPVAIEPDFIESVEAADCQDTCIVRMSSGKEHFIQRSYTYVTSILRKHYESSVNAVA